MSRLVREVVADVLSPEWVGAVDLRAGDLPGAVGDRTLIRQLWTNLIDNAIKYTGFSAEPCIEVDGYVQDGMHMYFVKDNGAGFDPRYTDKLFGAFQRLHKSSDFEGTGVGLAIVQRIVHLHGGVVWARGEVDKGATFFFALPSPRGNT
jgi:light-regulated signal transduction histidine kinase (bacteriophytochrome)